MYKKLKEPKIKKIKKIITKKEKGRKIEIVKKLKINPILKWIYLKNIN